MEKKAITMSRKLAWHDDDARKVLIKLTVVTTTPMQIIRTTRMVATMRATKATRTTTTMTNTMTKAVMVSNNTIKANGLGDVGRIRKKTLRLSATSL